MSCQTPDCQKPEHARGWCSTCYKRLRRRGELETQEPHAKPGEPLAFAKQVVVMPEQEGCIDWPYAVNGDGYAMIDKTRVTHIVLELRGHPKPLVDPRALHSCDRPVCIAWWHLHWGTASENQYDAWSRGTRRDARPRK